MQIKIKFNTSAHKINIDSPWGQAGFSFIFSPIFRIPSPFSSARGAENACPELITAEITNCHESIYLKANKFTATCHKMILERWDFRRFIIKPTLCKKVGSINLYCRRGENKAKDLFNKNKKGQYIKLNQLKIVYQFLFYIK